MRKQILLFLTFIPFLLPAQILVFSDDFESYTSGDLIAASSSVWTTWSGGITSEDAPVSSAQANSGVNSIYFVGTMGPSDVVLPFPTDYTTGIYELTMKMFMEGGTGGYFNMQESSAPGVNWMFEVYFDNAGGGEINAGGNSAATFSYTPATWIDIVVHVDLDNDLAELMIENVSVYTWQWSLGATGAGASAMWGGMNLYTAAFGSQDASFYVDDVVLNNLTPSSTIANHFSSSVEVNPNLSNGIFQISIRDYSGEFLKWKIIDMAGRVVKDEAIFNSEESASYMVDLSDFSNGMYFLHLSNAESESTWKLVKN